jgi:DNA polymerase
LDLITLDFETYYADDYTLSKMTTEAYIRDPRFETILMSAKVNDRLGMRAVGHTDVGMLLDNLDIENNAVLAHHAHFDGLILSHHYGHKPKVWFDTLSMARALHGITIGNSLAKLMSHYGVGEKGTAYIDAKNKRLADFTSKEILDYGIYCIDDGQGTYDIFQKMLPEFQKSELKIIDMVVRMFTEPILLLDEEMLRDYKQTIEANKLTLLLSAGVTLDEVMSNDKFAAALQRAGIITPPQKISPTTGKMAWAFAKTDKGLQALAEHESDQVQALVAARLGNKSTINETRAERMADMAARGPACIYLKYSGAAQTHRLSGGDSMNWQNLERVWIENDVQIKGQLRSSIHAPEGYVIVSADSRSIESRVVDWLAKQDDALEVYRAADAGTGPNVYCVMAAKIYNREITKKDLAEYQLGKVTKLACGFQMGYERFRETVRIMAGLDVDNATAQVVVDIYRATHPMVKLLWNRGQNAITSLASGPEDEKWLDPHRLLPLEKGAILLPNGLRIRYPELSFDSEHKWIFKSQRGEYTHLYGGKIIENCVQALARIIVLEQTLEISRRCSAARMSVHDEGVFCVEEAAAEDLKAVALEVMSTPPWWCPDLPLAAEVNIAQRYGDCK